MTHIDLILHQNHKEEITSFLKANTIHFSEPKMFSTSSTLDEVLLLLNAIPWESIAAIVVAWIARKPKRRIKFTFIDNTCIDATNYSPEEIKKLLSEHKRVNLHLHDEDDSRSA